MNTSGRHRAVRSLRRKRNRRRTQKLSSGMHALRMMFSLLLAVTTLVGLSLGVRFGWECLRHSEKLAIDVIDISGHHRTTLDEVRMYTGIAEGDSVLGVDLDAIALGLRRHPWIKNVSVQRQFPDRIAIHVEEHRAHILVALDGVYIANSEGHVFKKVAAKDVVKLPIVSGLERHFLAQHPEKSAEIIRTSIALAEAVRESLLGEPEQLLWDQALGWSVVTKPYDDGAPTLSHLGFDPVPRIELAARAAQRTRSLKQRAQTIWADAAGPIERVYVSSEILFKTEPTGTFLAKAGE